MPTWFDRLTAQRSAVAARVQYCKSELPYARLGGCDIALVSFSVVLSSCLLQLSINVAPMDIHDAVGARPHAAYTPHVVCARGHSDKQPVKCTTNPNTS
jgi:hypothetical protein